MKAKQVAQQEATRARFGEEKIEQQHKAAIISAEDDARAAYLLANSLATTGDGLIELRKLQAIEDMAYHLPYSWNITYLPAGPVSDPPSSPVRPPEANKAMTLIILNEVFHLSHTRNHCEIPWLA